MGVQVNRQAAAAKMDDSSSSDESSDSSSDSDAGKGKPAPPAKKAAPAAAAAADGDDESEDWSEDEEDDDDDSSEDEAYKGLTGRDRWVKRPGSEKKTKDEKDLDKKKAHSESLLASGVAALISFISAFFFSLCPLLSFVDKNKERLKIKELKRGQHAATLAAAEAAAKATSAVQAVDLSALEGKTPELAGAYDPK
jgi:hypothetical protein